MRRVLVLTLLLAAPASCLAQARPYLHAPAGDAYALHNPAGVTILPDGRLLKPAGTHTPLARWPSGLAMTRDGKTLFVASDGVGQLIDGWQGEKPEVSQVLLDGGGGRRSRTSAGACAFSQDGATLYWSTGNSGFVAVVDVAKRRQVGAIALNVETGGRTFADSFVSDIKVSDDGKWLYCADVTNFRVAVADTARMSVSATVPVGRYPYALTVAGSRVYVANIGEYEYSAIGRPDDPNFDPRGLTFPPFAVPSAEARNGVQFEGRSVPGLGDPNAPEAFSVWSIDVSDPTHPAVADRIKTGIKVGATANGIETIGGSAPNYLAAYGNSLYVCNNNNDSIDTIALDSGRIRRTTRIVPSELTARLRGVSPAGMALSPDGRRLYVAESGLNAIAVIETGTGRVLGHIPTPWYPYRLAMAPDGGRLACISFRGFGNGPNAGKSVPNSSFLGMKGALTFLNVPKDRELAAMTRTTLECAGLVDRSTDRAKMSSPVVPTTPGAASSQIKYVVFITKENHTYDTIFDHIPGANDDPSLLRWGYHQKIASPGEPTLDDAAVMTNHNALAKQFTVSDNFYMEPEASGVGHRWLIGVQPNNFCQMTYTLGWDFRLNSTAPGRRASFGSNGSIAPEDYPEAGSMWEHLARHGVHFRNYGEGFEFAGVGEDEREGATGAREVINMPMSKVVYDSTCRDFPIFNMNIPDVFRAEWFAKDFQKLFMKSAGASGSPAAPKGHSVRTVSAHGEPAPSRASRSRADTPTAMPSFINICICNDHGTEPKPARGYPYRASWMADNDLALGRIVEFLTHTPYWKNMAIFVTQDDAGGEPDHVDAQRSVLLVISPWAKRHNVSHRHTTIVSMHRTLYEILGLPPLNLQDAIANDFADCFTTTPDYTPYSATAVDAHIFDPEKARDLNDPEFKKARTMPSIRMDDPDEVERGANDR